MSIKKTRAVLAVGFIALAAATTIFAQKPTYRLPANHARQHSELIANQKPVANTKINPEVAKSVAAREAEAEIFNTAWHSQSVNPYGSSVSIPAHKTLNVADFHMPVPGRVTSPFGWRARFGRMHKGVDMSLRVGDTVRSAFSGKVRLTKFEGKGYGYYVVVRHDNGMETVYGHLSRFLVKPNQRVKAGEPIALGGNTGRSTGPHLHFETRYMGLCINPADIIDFANKTTYRETFAFDLSKVRRALAVKGSTKSVAADKSKQVAGKTGKSTVKKSSKKIASKSTKSKSKRSRRR